MEYLNETKDITIIKKHRAKIVVGDDYEAMSEAAMEYLHEEILKKPDLLMSIATGSTPTLAYDKLSERYKENPEAFNKLRLIGLDEWGGVPLDDPCTCITYIKKHLTAPMDIPDERYISWNSNPSEPELEVKRIKKIMEEMGDIDVCILGMGVNGHLGFNEPAKELHIEPHIAVLANTTKQHTMAKEAEHEIKYGLTLGMGDIMRSKKIILLVNGSHKVEQFKRFMEGEISTEFPASMLWMHPDLTVFCDKEAYPES